MKTPYTGNIPGRLMPIGQGETTYGHLVSPHKQGVTVGEATMWTNVLPDDYDLVGESLFEPKNWWTETK